MDEVKDFSPIAKRIHIRPDLSRFLDTDRKNAARANFSRLAAEEPPMPPDKMDTAQKITPANEE